MYVKMKGSLLELFARDHTPGEYSCFPFPTASAIANIEGSGAVLRHRKLTALHPWQPGQAPVAAHAVQQSGILTTEW